MKNLIKSEKEHPLSRAVDDAVNVLEVLEIDLAEVASGVVLKAIRTRRETLQREYVKFATAVTL